MEGCPKTMCKFYKMLSFKRNGSGEGFNTTIPSDWYELVGEIWTMNVYGREKGGVFEGEDKSLLYWEKSSTRSLTPFRLRYRSVF